MGRSTMYTFLKIATHTLAIPAAVTVKSCPGGHILQVQLMSHPCTYWVGHVFENLQAEIRAEANVILSRCLVADL